VTIADIQSYHYSSENRSNLQDKFELAAYRPKNIDEALKLCLSVDLTPKVSEQLDDFFNNFYTFNSQIDPIDSILLEVKKSIESKRATTSRFNYYLGLGFLLALDLFSIFRKLISRNPLSSYRVLKSYNFNRLIHRPNAFMRNIREKSFN
jgi:hypothetical protein